MGIFESILQGIVQGVTEFLPVSSSGHLLLAQHILGVNGNNLFFNVMLHLGTLLAVLAVYYKLVLRLILAFFSLIGDIFRGEFNLKKLNGDKRLVVMLIIGLLPLFLLFLPLPGTKGNIKDLAEKFSNDSYIIIVGISLVVTSILLFAGSIKAGKARCCGEVRQIKSTCKSRKFFNISDAISVGLMQCVAAIFPGLSRSGSTLSVGLLRGIDRQTALDYSFVLGIPSIIAAAILELKESMEVSSAVSVGALEVICGVISSALVGFASIILFKWMLSKNKIGIFIVYTFVVGIITIFIGLYEISQGVNIFTGVPL